MPPQYLTIVRHAKAAIDSNSGRDFDRPLAPKGLKQITRIVDLIRNLKTAPEWIVSSPALRARQTAEALAGEIDYTRPIVWDDRIYAAAPATLLAVLHDAPEQAQSVLLVGHNPGVAGLVSALCAGAERRVNLRFPTAAFALFEPEIVRWRQLRWGSCELRLLVAPRFLR